MVHYPLGVLLLINSYAECVLFEVFNEVSPLDCLFSMVVYDIEYKYDSIRLYKSLNRLMFNLNLPVCIRKLDNYIRSVSYTNTLTKIHLSAHNLTSILPLSLPYLRHLNLYNNDLTSLPVLDLPRLKTFDCSYNKLSAFDEESFNFPLLTELCAGNNMISVLPNFDCFPLLKILYVPCNRFTTIPNFSNLPKLTLLSIGYNEISTIPDFDNIPLLLHFSLNNNTLTQLPNFSNIPRLTTIDCSYNMIEFLPDFKYLSNLKNLLAHNNRLTSVHPYRGLALLNIDGNRIKDNIDLEGTVVFSSFHHIV